MLEINLLPWREQNHLRAQRMFWNAWILCTCGITAFILYINWSFLMRIDQQILTNQTLAKQITSLAASHHKWGEAARRADEGISEQGP